MKCRSTGRIVVYHVDNKSRGILIPKIIDHVNPGAIILTDKSSSYLNIRRNLSALDPLGFNHFWINHTREWVHPVNPSIHTNGIERTWRSLKSSISYIKRSVPAHIIDDYINSFLIKCYFNEEQILEILLDILSHFSL